MCDTRGLSNSDTADYQTILDLMAEPKMCAKCGKQPAGPGGVLCPGCRSLLAERAARYWHDEPPATAAGGGPAPDVATHEEASGAAAAPVQ